MLGKVLLPVDQAPGHVCLIRLYLVNGITILNKLPQEEIAFMDCF